MDTLRKMMSGIARLLRGELPWIGSVSKYDRDLRESLGAAEYSRRRAQAEQSPLLRKLYERDAKSVVREAQQRFAAAEWARDERDSKQALDALKQKSARAPSLSLDAFRSAAIASREAEEKRSEIIHAAEMAREEAGLDWAEEDERVSRPNQSSTIDFDLESRVNV